MPDAGTTTSSSRPHRWRVRVLAALTALGVLGAVGAYYVPGILDRVGAQVTGRLPIEVDLVLDRTETANYVFPDSLRPVEVAAERDDGTRAMDDYQWIREHGGVPADEQTVRLIVWGRSAATVHIEEVRAHVIGRAAPRRGWYNANDGCGAITEPRRLNVDFDRSPPTQTWTVGGEEVERPSFTVTNTEQEVFDVTVTTSHDEVTWVIELVYRSAERDGVLRIENRGGPFVTTSVANARAYLVGDPEVGDAAAYFVRFPSWDGAKLKQADHPVC